MRSIAIASVIAALVTGCEYVAPPTLRAQEERCAELPPGARRVAWRELAPPIGCTPESPAVVYPIRDEAAFRAAFPCAGDSPAGIDFATERLDAIPISQTFGGEPRLSIAQRGDALLVRVVGPPQCGGAQAGKTARLIVLPRDVPPRALENTCTVGSCPTGRPIP